MYFLYVLVFVYWLIISYLISHIRSTFFLGGSNKNLHSYSIIWKVIQALELFTIRILKSESHFSIAYAKYKSECRRNRLLYRGMTTTLKVIAIQLSVLIVPRRLLPKVNITFLTNKLSLRKKLEKWKNREDENLCLYKWLTTLLLI